MISDPLLQYISKILPQYDFLGELNIIRNHNRTCFHKDHDGYMVKVSRNGTYLQDFYMNRRTVLKMVKLL